MKDGHPATRAWSSASTTAGFTTAAPPASAPHLQQWLADGRHGEMNWLDRNADKRVNPQLVLPGAQSAILLRHQLCDGHSALRTPHSRIVIGEVARYARFTDYHDVLAERLKSLDRHRE